MDYIVKALKWIGIIVGGLVVLFIIIGIIAVATSPDDTEEPAQIQPTSPAETIEPVSPPTTPEKPVITPSEQAYVTTVADQAALVGQAFTELGELFQNPQFGNDQWTIKVATQLTILRMVYDEAMDLDPPSSMAENHLKYTQAMKYFNDATYLIVQGVDELDPSLLDAATEKILTGNRLLNEATQLMLEFAENK